MSTLVLGDPSFSGRLRDGNRVRWAAQDCGHKAPVWTEADGIVEKNKKYANRTGWLIENKGSYKIGPDGCVKIKELRVFRMVD